MNSLTLKEKGFSGFIPLQGLTFSSLPLNKSAVIVLADTTLARKPTSDLLYIGKTKKPATGKIPAAPAAARSRRRSRESAAPRPGRTGAAGRRRWRTPPASGRKTRRLYGEGNDWLDGKR